MKDERKGSRAGEFERKCHTGSCLVLRSFWAFYIRDSVCRYKVDLVICDMSVVSEFKNEIRVTLL